MNYVSLIGFVGKDPEKKEANSTLIASFSLATNDGTKEKPFTNWHNLTAFNKTAEVVLDYVRKGSKIAIQGRINYREYEKEGIKHRVTDITVDKLELLDRRETETSAPAQAQEQKTEPVKVYEQSNSNDDLPF